MKTAIYTRVSTDKQTDDSQLNELREYCQRRNWENAIEYRDVITGASISSGSRQADGRRTPGQAGRNRLLQAGSSWPQSRPSSANCRRTDDASRRTGVSFTRHRHIGHESGNPASEFQLNVLMAVAQFERSIIQERVSAGLRAAKAKGVKLGRPTTLNQHAQSVRSLVNQGLDVRAIARRLELPIASVFKLVKNAQ